ncbi:hypothetical protein VLK31_15670 [Variovorax sp. H27-G14]|uniref:hypothetical protein n=1 Tax=Variovorax sp. H27-G14 TaxID=3111914 RepID=UPI0038FC5078
MTSTGPSSQFAHFDDETLAELALTWRARAHRGEREAFGTAHALEVEVRRRMRELPAPEQTEPEAVVPAPVAERPWWKFWD